MKIYTMNYCILEVFKLSNVLVVGLDGAPYKFIEMWRKIPEVGEYFSKCSSGLLKSTIPAQTSVALPSLFTGMNPAKTNVFECIDDAKGIVRFDKLPVLKLWDILDYSKIRSLFYNTRIIYPLPYKKYCVFIDSGLSVDKCMVKPQHYIKYLQDFPLEGRLIEWKIKNKPTCDEIAERIIQVIKQKSEIFLDIVSENSFDFIFYWIGETDLLHHFCWGNNTVISKSYRRIWNVLFKLFRYFRDWNIFILSDHGAEMRPCVNFYIDKWLSSKGYLKMNKSAVLMAIIYFIARKILPFHVRNRFVKSNRERVSSVSNVMYHGIDYDRSIAFYSRDWGISINKKISNVNNIRRKLINDLIAVEFQGKKVFREIFAREELYTGPFEHSLPDIIFRAHEEFEIKPGPSFRIFGKAERDRHGYVGSHNWAREGIFIATGPDIKKGYNIGELQIYDIFPTVLYQYGLGIPEDIDGRVIDSIFNEKKTIRYIRYPKMLTMLNKIKKLKKSKKL